MNKADLTTPEALARTEAWINQAYPALRNMACERAQISIEILDAEPIPLPGGEAAAGHVHEEQYVRWSLESAEPLSRAKLEAALSALPTGVLRLKGIVSLSGEEGSWSVQCVGARWTIAPHAQSRDNRLVAIGLRSKISRSVLDDLFAAGNA